MNSAHLDTNMWPTREIRKIRFVANFEYVPQVFTPIYPYHQKEKVPKIIFIIY